MILAAALYLLAAGTLVAIGARLGEEVLRLLGRPARWAWVAALAVLVALVVAVPVRTGSVGGPTAASVPTPLTPANVEVPRGRPSLLERTIAAARGALDDGVRRVAAVARTASPAGAGAAFGYGWLAASAAALILLGRVYVQFHRARASWPRADLPNARVRVSDRIGPAVIGVLDPEIVVPAWFLGLDAAEQRAILAHERAHIEARDPLLLAFGCLVVALLPWHPAAWWMLARLRLTTELDCDRRVLRRGFAARAYGTTLIDIAARCTRLPLGTPALADSTSHLERRLIAMTSRPVRFGRTRAVALAAVAGLTLLAACDVDLPTSAEIEQLDARAAEQPARRLMGTDSVTYFVDGIRVPAEVAASIAAERIASIDVSKHGEGRRTGEIRITTVASARTDTATARVRTSEGSGTRMALRSESPMRGSDVFRGLVFIDGVRASAEAMSRIAPDAIQSIEVIKATAAERLYPDEPLAKHGVIRVTTKAKP